MHLPEHTDFNLQGYIGVSKNPINRLWEHHNDVKKNNHCNPYLSRIIKKYSQSIIQTIIFEGEETDCYQYEELLRPVKHIGWNINKGGSCPPSAAGRKLSDEHKRKIGEGNTGKKHPHVEVSKQKISKANSGKSLTENHKQKVRGTTRSSETKKKLSLSHVGNIPGNAKSVITSLGTFTSISKAAHAHKLSRFKFEKLLKNDSNFKVI
jgi:group I intron endonuclease